ncbi:MAG: bifunctional 3'-5' exonuclease/DNA polymerase [Xenococcaceae cyanobacterium]
MKPLTSKNSLKRYRKPRTAKTSNTVTTSYQLINRADELETTLAPLKDAKVIGLDCETTGLDPYTAKIRTIQLAIPNHPVVVIDLFAVADADLSPLRSLLASSAVKVGHNLKFEWLMLRMAELPFLPPFFDTYLGYRVLTAGLKQSLSLEAISAKLLKVKLDKTQQHSDWSGTLTPTQLEYAATDAAIVLPLRTELKRRLKQANLLATAKLEFACLSAVAMMELNGMYLDWDKWEALGINLIQQRTRLLTQINQELRRPPTEQISLFPDLTETINPRSSKQVLAALQAKGISVQSTSAQVLIPLAKEYPVIQALLDYRSLSTRISTFTEGLPEHIHPITGRIHPNWFQIGARSGRFSCREPNLQNIPRDRETRQCFTAALGKVLIKADYSQIELRIMAKVSGDRRMCQAYRQREDLHRLTASLVFGKSIIAVTEEERRLGKIINFGLVYGMGAKKFRSTAAKDYGVEMTIEQASEFRKKFFESYPGIKGYHEKVRREWSRGVRESRTLGGRRRLWGKYQKPKLNELINNPVQGTNSDITKLALALAWQCFEGTEVQIIAAIHDEIVIECPLEVTEWVISQLRRCMVSAGNYFIAPIPVEMEIKAFSSWGG